MREAVELFHSRGLRPRKALGQNFLLDHSTAERIAVLLAPDASGSVLEIGPGLGALTEPLLARAERVIALEKDPALATILRETLLPHHAEKLSLIEGDATKLSWLELLAAAPKPWRVGGNLPYAVTGTLLEALTRLAPEIDRAVIMVQREVADRLCALPGTREYGALTVFVQAQLSVQRALVVGPAAFTPRPSIDSAVLTLTPRSPPIAPEDEFFRQVVRGAFSMRRKTLRNAWRGLFGWSQDSLAEAAAACEISLDARGETLPVETFARMAAYRRERGSM